VRSVLRGVVFVAFSAVVLAQAPAPSLPRGTATDVSNADIMAGVQETGAAPTSDQALRVVHRAAGYVLPK
jgi:hypothetical protein